MGAEWIDNICDELALADSSPLLILIDKADDAQLPALLRAVTRRFGDPALCVSVKQLAEITVGAVVLFAPAFDQFDLLNQARALLRERRLRVLVWCDAARTQRFVEQASDVYDWISRYIECPPAAHSFAVSRLRRWAADGEPYVELTGNRWRSVMDALDEPWIEVPRESLRDYDRLVEFIRHHPGHRLASTVPTEDLDYFAGVRLVVAALTEGCPLPVVLAGRGHMRWYKRVDSEAPALSEIIVAAQVTECEKDVSELASLGRELMSFDAAWKRLGEMRVPVPQDNDPALETVWDEFDRKQAENPPISMDPSRRLLSLCSMIGSGRRTESIASTRWSQRIADWEMHELSDIFASWHREALPFARSNAGLVQGVLTNADERVDSMLSVDELLNTFQQEASEAARDALASVAVVAWASHSLARGDLRAAQRELRRALGDARFAASSRSWMTDLVDWLAGDAHGSRTWLPPADLPPMLEWLAVQESLDRGEDPIVSRKEHVHRSSIDAIETWLPLVHQARYGQGLAAPHVEEPNDIELLTPTIGEERGRLLDLRARVLRGELAMETGLFDVAERQLELGIAQMTSALGAQHPMTLVAIAMRGRFFALLGSQQRAEHLLRDAHSLLAQQLGAAHQDTLRVRLELARLSTVSSTVEAARDGLQAALAARFGDRSPLTQLCVRGFRD